MHSAARCSPIPLPSPLQIMGTPRNQITIDNNGFIYFDGQRPSCGLCFTPGFPTSEDVIAPLWADVNTLNGGQVVYRVSANPADLTLAQSFFNQPTSPSYVFVVTWDQVS